MQVSHGKRRFQLDWCPAIRWLVFCLLVAGLQTMAAGQLETNFQEPPADARPWVYWFWLNGNLTRQGVTADLEAMHRVGIGGVLIMEVDQGIPAGPVRFAGPAWRDLFQFMLKEASRLDIQVDMNNDAGWCGSGGPWNTPDHAMQKLVWTTVSVKGPMTFHRRLVRPKAVAGYYRDIAVLAFPTPASDKKAKTGFRIGNIQGKAAFSRSMIAVPARFPVVSSDQTIPQARIVDLTSAFHSGNDRLTWSVPPGNWTVLRIGYTPTGKDNHPAPLEGRGLECDKLSREAVDLHFAGLMGKLIRDAGPLAGPVLSYTHVDSWEVHSQNWTPRLRQEFEKRRGYDLLPFLPVLTGRVVRSLGISERFLWDWRKTLSELVAENYAGRLAELAHAHGLKLSIEAYGDGPFDDLSYAGRADSPMAEFWVGGGARMGQARAMASAAHVYGKNILGAEAFTASNQVGKWLNHPYTLKALGDAAFCAGINRLVVHRYAFQPWLNRRPGMTMGPWGVHYERTNTWWDLSRPWHQYLARCQYMLRRGLFVADICFLQTEDAPNGLRYFPDTPYAADGCTPEVAMTRMQVRDGRLVLPDGMSYRILVLPSVQTMTLPLLNRIAALVQAGATVVGRPPLRSPSLANFPECDRRIQEKARELWGDCDGREHTVHTFGKGRIIWGQSPEEVLRGMGVSPDFQAPLFHRDGIVRYIHRVDGKTDIYFVANTSGQAVDVPCTFRRAAGRPEFWHPDSGKVEPVAVYEQSAKGTRIPIRFDPRGSVFVVFRSSAATGHFVRVLDAKGNAILPQAWAAPTVQVHRAVYGVLGDPARTRDVTAAVQRLAGTGHRRFRVADLAKDGDPAPNIVKTLRIEYDAGGNTHHVEGTDPQTVTLSAPPDAKITVQRAMYGILADPKRTRDVTRKLQKLLDQKRNSFRVAELARGDDPAYLIVKTLRAECTVDGVPRRLTGTDPETIALLPRAGPRPAEVRTGENGRTFVEVRTPGRFTLETAAGLKLSVTSPPVPPPVPVTGPWRVVFPVVNSAPVQVRMPKLTSWTDSKNERVRYFSGTASYTRTLSISPALRGKNRLVMLDLGHVAVIAHVFLNGEDLGILWKPPFRLDITEHARPGDNGLEVQVTNLWPNRLIGDEHLPEDSKRTPRGNLVAWPQWLLDGKPSPTGRQTFTTWRHWTRNSPLLESGLLGPILIESRVRIPVQVHEKPRHRVR